MDNYQGEEGKVCNCRVRMNVTFVQLTMLKIVILSLVRNSGGAEDELEMQTISQHTRVNIGFLKVRGDIHLVNMSADLDIHFAF